MKWELDDNARSGFHYLVLGAVVIGVPSMLLWWFDSWHASAVSSGELALGMFHNGYLIFDGNTTSVADTSRGERLAYACSIALASALVIVLVLLLTRSRMAWLVGRWVFVVVFAWCVCSALFLPRMIAEAGPGMLRVQRRQVIMGDITLPFSARTTEMHWSKQDTLLGLSMPAPGITDVFRMSANRVHGGDTLLFAITGTREGHFAGRATHTSADDALNHLDSLLFQR